MGLTAPEWGRGQERVLGHQVVPHLDWEMLEEQAEEEAARRLAIRKQGQHGVHEGGWVSVLQPKVVDHLCHLLPVSESVGGDQLVPEILVGGRRGGRGALDQAADQDHDLLGKLLDNDITLGAGVVDSGNAERGFGMKEPEFGVHSPEVHELDHDPGDKLGDDGGRRRRRRLRLVRQGACERGHQ